MPRYPRSAAILQNNCRFIPGGVVSVNRAIEPKIVFERGLGQYLWDVEGNRYVDYHAAFAAHFLGHNDPYVNDAIADALQNGASLYGSGTTVLEGKLAQLICRCVPFVDSVQLLNTGSEATAQAIRLARAATGRNHIIVVQGGYNGWHNDVACNLMSPLDVVGQRRSPGEYPFVPISAGIPTEHQKLVHVVNFNDPESVEYVCTRYPVGALITEPVLQNIGVVRPLPGYLKNLRKLADRHGFVLVLDEVKTGFRHALGGYAALEGIQPDLVVYGKALANGYPIAALAGKSRLMDLFITSDPDRRVLLAGTYNGHPVPTAAAIATIERLMAEDGAVYKYVELLGQHLEDGLKSALADAGLCAAVAREGSALCPYYMDHVPVDWHDLARAHDFELDRHIRCELVRRGVYVFPLATKQWSISAAHTTADIDTTVDAMRHAVAASLEARGVRAR